MTQPIFDGVPSEATVCLNRTITSVTIKKGEREIKINSGGVWVINDIGHQLVIEGEMFHLTEELEPLRAKVEFPATEDHIDVPCTVNYYSAVSETMPVIRIKDGLIESRIKL